VRIVHSLPRSPNLTSDRYAFRSEEKVALQEIGPRFTLKLRWLKKNIPAVYNLGEAPAPLVIEKDEEDDDPVEASKLEEDAQKEKAQDTPKIRKTIPPKQDEYLWQWKVRFCTDLPLQPPLTLRDLSRTLRLRERLSSCSSVQPVWTRSLHLLSNHRGSPPPQASLEPDPPHSIFHEFRDQMHILNSIDAG